MPGENTVSINNTKHGTYQNAMKSRQSMSFYKNGAKKPAKTSKTSYFGCEAEFAEV